MKRPSTCRTIGLALTMALLLPALPAAAREGAAEDRFELALGDERQPRSSLLMIEPSLGDAADAKAPPISLSQLRAEAWAMPREEAGQATATAAKRGFGGWLKKRWYVPVLAAVVLAVALDDGDDDRAGEED